MQIRLALNWLKSAHLCLPSASVAIKGVHHHAHLVLPLVKRLGTVKSFPALQNTAEWWLIKKIIYQVSKSWEVHVAGRSLSDEGPLPSTFPCVLAWQRGNTALWVSSLQALIPLMKIPYVHWVTSSATKGPTYHIPHGNSITTFEFGAGSWEDHTVEIE